MDTQWIWDPPAPWEYQFRDRVGHTPRSLGLNHVAAAQEYLHVHGIHRFEWCAKPFGCDLPGRKPRLLEQIYSSFIVKEEQREAERAVREQTYRIAEAPDHLYTYCGPEVPFQDEDDREDPEWRSFLAYETQWHRDFPVRRRDR